MGQLSNLIDRLTKIGSVIVLVLLTAQQMEQPSVAAGDLVIYADALAADWQNWSWNTTRRGTL